MAVYFEYRSTFGEFCLVDLIHRQQRLHLPQYYMPEPIYVIGHKNPDADAICAAISYAWLKRSLTGDEYVAARCGNSNARIDAILRRFEENLPQFLGDVTPRVRDIMVRDPHTVTAHNTCAEALEIIDRVDVRVLPVVDPKEHLKGTVSIFQLGEYFVPKPRKPSEMRHVHTSIDDIVRSLKAEVLNLENGAELEDLYVRVGAMDIRSFGKFTNEAGNAANQHIIIVGDRWDIQQKSIQAGVRLLVITGGLAADDDILEMAKERRVSLVVSPYDSATTSWIIRSASRVERLVERDHHTFSAEEKLSVARRRIANQYAILYMVTDESGKLIGVFSNGDLLKPPRTRLILVDHNELSQAVTGADRVVIEEIIDHHRLGNPPSQQPIRFINEPVGSTCTIIADLCQRFDQTPTPSIAGILLGGIISDTLHLQSPTTTDRDKEAVEWLTEIAGIESKELAEMIFSSGSVILSSTPEEVIRADMKIYEEGDVRYSVSQVEELGFGNFEEHAEDLLEALETVRSGESLFFSTLLVTDIHSQNSLLVYAGEDEMLEQISYPKSERAGVFDLPGIVSRKKQLIPYLTTLLRNLGIDSDAR